ncbi:hypothetical protein PanWU01x14_078930, partial [Parasponia andersonii]
VMELESTSKLKSKGETLQSESNRETPRSDGSASKLMGQLLRQIGQQCQMG